MKTRAWISLLVLVGCGDPDPPARPDASPGVDVTWHRDVRPVVESRCVGCHAGALAPFEFNDFEADIAPRRELIVGMVQSRTMPPFHQNPDCREAMGSQWLSDAELEIFASWRDGGFVEGDPTDFVAPERPSQPAPPPEPSFVFTLSEGYRPDVDRPDDYRCIPIGDPLDRDSWLTRVEVLPDRLEIVHHVLLYVVPPENLDAMRALDASEPGPGWTCFGDAGLEGTDQIGGWVPGADSDAYDESVGQRVRAGAQIVMQMHYNVIGRDDAPEDRTSVAFWRLPEGETPAWQIRTVELADIGIEILAGDGESTHSSLHTYPIRGTIVGAAPHMHTLGTRLGTELVRSDGATECISGVEGYDFDWQRSYAFAEAQQVEVMTGDRFRLSCTYDNSEGNQPVVNGARQDPQNVYWGDGTRDEMCLNYVAVLTPAASGFERCAGYDACVSECADGDIVCAYTCAGTVGPGCLDCIAEVDFGACAEARCGAELAAIEPCYTLCTTPNDIYGCLLDACEDQTSALHECVGTAIAAGECPGAVDACPGWTP